MIKSDEIKFIVFNIKVFLIFFEDLLVNEIVNKEIILRVNMEEFI